MDIHAKRMFGKILGEIYRLQQTIPGKSGLGQATIFGLINGVETVIDEELERVGWVSRDELEAVGRILDAHFNDPEKLAAFKGYYDIEYELQAAGIDRGKAITCLKYYHADGAYHELFLRMNSNHSPVECKNFKLEPWEK